MKRLSRTSRVLAVLLIASTVSIAKAAADDTPPRVDAPGADFIPNKPVELAPQRPVVEPPRPSSPVGERGALMRIPPNGDLRSLQGCWETNPYRYAPGAPSGRSTYCFDANGRGQLTHVESGVTCRAPAHIEFRPDGSMYLADSNSTCDDGSAWHQDRLRCRPGTDGAAMCAGEGDYAPGQTRRWATTLRRR
jgi:hypothetical protein